MTTFVVLAAGRGSRLGRVGDELHKSLVPLNGKAILTHQFELAPLDAKIVVVTGYRAEQVESYVQLAHPSLNVTFVQEHDWGYGPGRSLLMAESEVEGDLIFTACDTLWQRNTQLWDASMSWMGVAPIPAGTPAARWCRVVDNSPYVERILDKTPDVVSHAVAWTALGYVVADDLPTFWQGLHNANAHAGELQLSPGFNELLHAGRPVASNYVDWLDVGDQEAYRLAQAQQGSYDTVKPGQATYVLPTQGRVVKFNADRAKTIRRVRRSEQLAHVTSPVVGASDDMVAYDYVHGLTGYDKLNWDNSAITQVLLNWWHDEFWVDRCPTAPDDWISRAFSFYHDRVHQRVNELNPMLRSRALDVVTRINWDELIDETTPGPFHGDFTYANVIFASDGIRAIDWREDFAEQHAWGDLRYDLAKLLGATQFHWQNASRGDFRFWPAGGEHATQIIQFASEVCDLDPLQLNIMGALTLIASAPLHAAPMDEILVARGTHWLGQYL